MHVRLEDNADILRIYLPDNCCLFIEYLDDTWTIAHFNKSQQLNHFSFVDPTRPIIPADELLDP